MNFKWDPQNQTPNHYDVILQSAKSGQVCNQDENDLGRQITTGKQMMQQHEYEVIDLTDDSDTTFMQQHVYFPYNSNNSQFPTTYLPT